MIKITLEPKIKRKIGLFAEFKLYNSYKNIKCKICGAIQGEPKNGFNRYYCDHYVGRVNRRMKEFWYKCLKEDIKDVLKEIDSAK